MKYNRKRIKEKIETWDGRIRLENNKEKNKISNMGELENIRRNKLINVINQLSNHATWLSPSLLSKILLRGSQIYLATLQVVRSRTYWDRRAYIAHCGSYIPVIRVVDMIFNIMC